MCFQYHQKCKTWFFFLLFIPYFRWKKNISMSWIAFTRFYSIPVLTWICVCGLNQVCQCKNWNRIRENLNGNIHKYTCCSFFFYFEVECSFVAKCVCHAIVYIYITCAFRNHGNLQDVENSLLTAANHAKPSRFRTALPQVRLFTAVWCFD